MTPETWREDAIKACAAYPECIELWRELALGDDDADVRRLARAALRLAFGEIDE